MWDDVTSPGARRPPSGPPDDAIWVCSLLSLPYIGPARLRQLGLSGPWDQVWAAIVAGTHQLPGLESHRDEIVATARTLDPVTHWRQQRVDGVEPIVSTHRLWPARLTEDPEPPSILFVRGRLESIDGPSVAVVGTRKCTAYGRTVARGLGAGLAAAGVHVVSGLAMGIDAAAHAGAIDAGGAPPVGVIAADFDAPVPSANIGLYRRVCAVGAVIGETPRGAAPGKWRFPARNRIVAALADAIVVVESRMTGGSMYTVDEALRRDRPVFAVPGPITSPASEGTNHLLSEGALPCTGAEDVLVALGVDPAGARPSRQGPGGAGLSYEAGQILGLLIGDLMPLDELVAHADVPLGRVMRSLDELGRQGLVEVRGPNVHRLLGP